MFVRLLRQAFLFGYLFLTLCALLYTLGRTQIPHVPWPFVTHFYAMMAPFQNYTTENAELMMYGHNADGSWTKIDHTAYFPFSRGEYAIRIRLSGLPSTSPYYREIARRVFEAENAQGRGFTSVRLQWEKWPKSQYGYYTEYVSGKVMKNPVANYPAES